MDTGNNYGPDSPPIGSLPPSYGSFNGTNVPNAFNATDNCNYSFVNFPLDYNSEVGNYVYNGNHFIHHGAYYSFVPATEATPNYTSNFDPTRNQTDCSSSENMTAEAEIATVVDALQYSHTFSAEKCTSTMTEPNNLNGTGLDTSVFISNPTQSPSINQDNDGSVYHALNTNNGNPTDYYQSYQYSLPITYQTSLPSYKQSFQNFHQPLQSQIQIPQQQQLLSPNLSFSGSSLDQNSTTTMSLPSPGNSVCSVDTSIYVDSSSISSTASVDSQKDLIKLDLSLTDRVNLLQQRLGLPADVQLELVNDGHGVKNPLANQSIEKTKSVVTTIRNDNGTPHFYCDVCNKTFALRRLLNKHMKNHSAIKKYLCTFCTKGFNGTFDLKRHTRAHTGVRPYKCNFCDKAFTQRGTLESHCMKVHETKHQYSYKQLRNKMYVCEECGNITSESESHFLHLKDKHPHSSLLRKIYDKRQFKFSNSDFADMLLQAST